MYPVKLSENTNAILVKEQLGYECHSYSERIRYYYDHFVVKESAPDFLEKMSADYLMEYLAYHDRLPTDSDVWQVLQGRSTLRYRLPE